MWSSEECLGKTAEEGLSLTIKIEQNEKASSASTKNNHVTISECLVWSQTCAQQMFPIFGGRCAKFSKETCNLHLKCGVLFCFFKQK